MFTFDHPHQDADDQASNDGRANAAGSDMNGSPQQNHVIGPLTDDELQTGGMERVVAFVRTTRSKEALRKEKQRQKQKEKGERQINVDLPDNERARATIRGAAAAIRDEVAHQAIELLVANEELRPKVIGIAARPDLQAMVDLIQNEAPTAQSLNSARHVIIEPDLAALVERAMSTERIREALKVAAANPEFIIFGRSAATEKTLCARLARLLLGVRRTRRDKGTPSR